MRILRYESDGPRYVLPKGCTRFNPIIVESYAARWIDNKGFGHEVVNEPVGGERKNGIKCYSFTCEKFELDPRYKDKTSNAEEKMNMEELESKDYYRYSMLLPTIYINMFTNEIIPGYEGCVECKFYYKNINSK